MNIELKAFAPFIPVLNEPGWWCTGANDSNSVRFRNTIYEKPTLTISVGIVTYYRQRGQGRLIKYDVLHSWEYCAHCEVPSNRLSIPIRTPTPRRKSQWSWQEVQDYYIKHGLRVVAHLG